MSFLPSGHSMTSVNTAAIAAQGSYRLSREGQQKDSTGASLLTLEPICRAAVRKPGRLPSRSSPVTQPPDLFQLWAC
jgi:hypothetical protein